MLERRAAAWILIWHAYAFCAGDHADPSRRIDVGNLRGRRAKGARFALAPWAVVRRLGEAAKGLALGDRSVFREGRDARRAFAVARHRRRRTERRILREYT